eukprot:5035487-Amphidinium_carterae.1
MQALKPNLVNRQPPPDSQMSTYAATWMPTQHGSCSRRWRASDGRQLCMPQVCQIRARLKRLTQARVQGLDLRPLQPVLPQRSCLCKMCLCWLGEPEVPSKGVDCIQTVKG